MELIARVLITIPDEQWNEWLTEEKPEDIKGEIEMSIQAALSPYPGSYSRNFCWKNAEFIEWEEA